MIESHGVNAAPLDPLPPLRDGGGAAKQLGLHVAGNAAQLRSRLLNYGKNALKCISHPGLGPTCPPPARQGSGSSLMNRPVKQSQTRRRCCRPAAAAGRFQL